MTKPQKIVIILGVLMVGIFVFGIKFLFVEGKEMVEIIKEEIVEVEKQIEEKKIDLTTQVKIEKIRDDLMIFNVKEENAGEIAEFLNNKGELNPEVGGTRDEFIRALNEAREESGMLIIGSIENKEDLLKMFNLIITVGAQMKKVKAIE